MLILIFLLAGMAFAQDPTWPTPEANFRHNGWVTGCTNDQAGTMRYLGSCTPNNAQPIGTFEPPLCQFAYSSNFQTPIRRITSPNAIIPYSTQTVFSAKNKYVMLVDMTDPMNGVVKIYNRRTCEFVRNGPTGTGVSVWSNYSDEKLYYHTGRTLRTMDVSTGTTAELINFNGTNGRPNYTSITFDGSTDMTKDEWITIHAPTEKEICTINLNVEVTPPSYCVDFEASIGSASVDFVIVSPGTDSVSGKRYIIISGNGSATAAPNTSLWSFTDAAPTPAFICIIESALAGTGNHNGTWVSGEQGIGTPHAAMGEMADGRQFYVSTDITGTSGNWVSMALLHLEGAAFATCFVSVHTAGSISGAQEMHRTA
jgi:hypothetical protein